MSDTFDEMRADLEAAAAAHKAKIDQSLNAVDRNAALLRDYAAHGLDPIYADKAQTIVCSLPLLLHMGWKIEQIDGKPTLVKPEESAA